MKVEFSGSHLALEVLDSFLSWHYLSLWPAGPVGKRSSKEQDWHMLGEPDKQVDLFSLNTDAILSSWRNEYDPIRSAHSFPSFALGMLVSGGLSTSLSEDVRVSDILSEVQAQYEFESATLFHKVEAA